MTYIMMKGRFGCGSISKNDLPFELR